MFFNQNKAIKTFQDFSYIKTWMMDNPFTTSAINSSPCNIYPYQHFNKSPFTVFLWQSVATQSESDIVLMSHINILVPFSHRKPSLNNNKTYTQFPQKRQNNKQTATLNWNLAKVPKPAIVADGRVSQSYYTFRMTHQGAELRNKSIPVTKLISQISLLIQRSYLSSPPPPTCTYIICHSNNTVDNVFSPPPGKAPKP